MTQPGYQPGSEPMWWWKVAVHLDAAQIALANAMAHNLDDPKPVFVLQDRLTEGQAILLEIFRVKGLIPASNGKAEVPMPGMSEGGGGPGGEVKIVAAEEPAVAEAIPAAAAEPEPPAAAPSPEVAAPAEIAPEAPPAGVGG